MPNEQLSLFPPANAEPKRVQEPKREPPAPPPPAPASATGTPPVALAPAAPLQAAITAYHEQMRTIGWSPHTIQAFGSDLKLFSAHIGAQIALNEITTETITEFLNWLRYDRGVPCKPKTYQRRLTTLKVFFAWLKHSGVLTTDPALPVAHIPVTTALPEILYDDQIAQLLAQARALANADKSDPRPLLLVTLLLATGIKKSEAMALRLSDIDVASRALLIRHDDAKKRFKERKLKLSAEFIETLPRYLAQYQPAVNLFECTARNLEYVLADLAQATNLGNTVSFESLRWTCAVQDYKNGMAEDHIRLKLGLSTITWEEDGERLKTLAGAPL